MWTHAIGISKPTFTFACLTYTSVTTRLYQTFGGLYSYIKAHYYNRARYLHKEIPVISKGEARKVLT